MRGEPTRTRDEGGFVFVVLLGVLMPLLALIITATSAMTARNGRTFEEIYQERAFLAAESGIDEAVYRAALGILVHGGTVTRDLGDGAKFSFTVVHLKADAADNDGDATIDEDDEDIFVVTSRGTYRSQVRRLVAGFGPERPPLDIESALTIFRQDPQIQIDFNGTGAIDGNDLNINGAPSGKPPVTGLAIQAPGTVADLTANYAVDDPNRITGSSPAPSLGVSNSGLDLADVVTQVQSSANIVLGAAYIGANWGSGAAGDRNVIYRDGDLALNGNVQGSGIMVVTGKLRVYDNFRFDGVLIVLGDMQIDGGDIAVYGGLIKGVTTKQIQFTDKVRIQYSSQAVRLSPIQGPPTGRYIPVVGWQEISRL
jgi:hypothetical protein